MMPTAENTRDRGGRLADLSADVRRAVREFLALPIAIIAIFAVVAVATFVLDHATHPRLAGFRSILQAHIFADPKATSDPLATIAGSLMGITAFSFGLLLLAVQQNAASMTSHVVDQFLRRRVNQFHFGFFVGLALYALAILATVGNGYNPIYGASLALLLTGVALCLLLLLLYTTINQIRPVVVIDALHDHILAARGEQLRWIRKTRRASEGPARIPAGFRVPVTSTRHGFVVRIDLDELEPVIRVNPDVEIHLLVSIGSFVAFGDVISEVNSPSIATARIAEEATRKAIRLERQRDLERDPAYGIEQLLTIAWTSVSTSKSNPAPGLLTIRALRDVLSRWVTSDGSAGPDSDGGDADRVLPIVYSDNVISKLMDALETLAVVSTESMQHQNFAEVLDVFTNLFVRLPDETRKRAEDLILRILSGLGDHVLTADLEASLAALARTLNDAGCPEAASAVQRAREELGTSIGRLNSRATRVPAAR